MPIPPRRFRRLCVSLCAAVLLVFGAAAQGPEPEEQDPVETPESEPAPAEPAVPMTGDIIRFKSGAVWGNVQVLRSTPKYYEVEQFPGLAPVQIGRSLVDSIEWDNIDPERERRLQQLMPQPDEPTVVSMDQLAPEFREKLTAPLSQETLAFANQVLGQVFTQLSELTGVPIEIDPSVRELPTDQKVWTVTLPPGTTLLSVLQDELPKAFPNLRTMFEFDKVKVMTAARMAELEAAPADTQPPPSPN
jgi:hypothetical protein